MNEEKVLGFLNLNKYSKKDKFIDKIVCGFNIGVSVFIGSALLFTSLSNFNMLLGITFLVIDAILVMISSLYKNPVLSFLIEGAGLFWLIIKFVIGYILISKDEMLNKGYPTFTWAHLAVLFLAIWSSIYIVFKFNQAYQIIKKTPLSRAKNKIQKKNPVPKWVIVVELVSTSPMIIVQIVRDDLENFKIGMGFCFFVLASLFSIIFVMCLYKIIVILRFKAYKYFK